MPCPPARLAWNPGRHPWKRPDRRAGGLARGEGGGGDDGGGEMAEDVGRERSVARGRKVCDPLRRG
eukprot:7929470-Pyramimonas_sp.AAC.1